MDERLLAARRMLDRRLAVLKLIERVGPSPRQGWVREIRTALGMSSYSLAARTGISPTRVRAFERAEVEGAIRLSNLSRLAQGMNCGVFYALVPSEQLESMVWRQAQRKATRELRDDGFDCPAGDDELPVTLETRARLESLTLRFLDHRQLWH